MGFQQSDLTQSPGQGDEIFNWNETVMPFPTKRLNPVAGTAVTFVKDS